MKPAMTCALRLSAQYLTVQSVCRATTFPYSYSGSLDGVLLHPYTFPAGYYTNFGLVRLLTSIT